MTTVTVVYKSGAKVKIRCANFTVTKRGGSLVEVEWDNARPKPLFFGVDEVAAIYEGKA